MKEDNCIGYSTGFFIEIPISSRKYPLYGLMTINHLLNEKSLKPVSTIHISFHNNNSNEKYSILINEEDFVFISK